MNYSHFSILLIAYCLLLIMYTTKARNDCEKTEISDKILKENISFILEECSGTFAVQGQKKIPIT